MYGAASHHMFFQTALKGEPKPVIAGITRFHGFKMPGLELLFSEFENLDWKSPPLWVYCLRKPSAVWKSWRAREFQPDFSTFRRRYLRSLRAANSIKGKAGPGRLAVFKLEDYLEAANPSLYVRQSLFEPLGISASFAWPRAPINRSASRSSRAPDEILFRQMWSLDKDAEIEEYRGALLEAM